MSAYTRGPWTYEPRQQRVCSSERVSVADIYGQSDEQMDANGTLIAVAPDLLVFVKEWLADFTAAGTTDSPHEAQARALLARVER